MFSKIMVPVDLKHTDEVSRAMAIATLLARTLDAELHIVGVTMSSPTEVARTPEEFAEKLRKFADEKSKDLGAPIKSHAEISHDMTIDLDQILMRTAKSIDADLIVMASHIPGLAEYVFSSNAGHLASHADISVMVVR